MERRRTPSLSSRVFAARPRHAFAWMFACALFGLHVTAANACDEWRLMPTPPVELTTIAAASPNDAMAVAGNRFYHWSGSEWRLTTGVSFPHASVSDIAAVPGTQRYWAVLETGGGTVMLRWDGERWFRMPSPRTGPTSAFRHVVPLGPRNVWAIGANWAGRSPGGDLIRYAISARWNGRRWRAVAVPRVGEMTTLLAADRAVPNGVWAVGFRAANERHATLAARWDGSKWTVSGVFRLAAAENVLLDVSAASARAAWAVGYISDEIVDREPLLLRWNGQRWRRSVIPTFEARSPTLTEVEAVSAREAWAIGGNGPSVLVFRWNGRRWQRSDGPPFPPPAPGSASTHRGVLDLARAPGTRTIWAVGAITDLFEKPGYEDYDARTQPVVARFC